MTDEKDYSLLRHNTFGIDAKCKRFIEYNTVEEAQQVAQMLTEPTVRCLFSVEAATYC